MTRALLRLTIIAAVLMSSALGTTIGSRSHRLMITFTALLRHHAAQHAGQLPADIETLIREYGSEEETPVPNLEPEFAAIRRDVIYLPHAPAIQIDGGTRVIAVVAYGTKYPGSRISRIVVRQKPTGELDVASFRDEEFRTAASLAGVTLPDRSPERLRQPLSERAQTVLQVVGFVAVVTFLAAMASRLNQPQSSTCFRD